MATQIATRKRQAWPVLIGVAGIALGIFAQSFVGGREYLLDGLLLYAAALALALRSLPMPGAGTPLDTTAPPQAEEDRGNFRFTPTATVLGCSAIAANGLALFLFGTDSAVNLAAILYASSVVAAPAALWVASGAPLPRLFAGWSAGELLVLVASLGIGAAMRLLGLDVLPYGLWWDEGFTGGQVARIASDPNYRPIFLVFPGQGAALSYYLCVPFVALFGPGPVGLRAMAALGGILGILTTTLLGRELFGKRAGLIAGFLVAVMAWQINFSRIAFNAIWSVSLDALTVYLFLRAVRTRQPLMFGLAGTSLGVAANMYHTTELILIVLALYLAHSAATRGLSYVRARLVGLVLLAGVALLTASPLVEFAVQHPAEFTARANQVSVLREVSERGSLDPITSNLQLHLGMFNHQGDRNGRHNIPGAPMLDMATGALFIIGLGMAAVRLRRSEPFVVMCWLPVMMAPGILSLSFEAPQSLRAIETITPVALLASLPLAALGTLLSRVGGPGLALGVGRELDRDARFVLPFGTMLLAVFLGWIGYLNYDRYFVRQASDPAVWREFSTAETEIARQINRLGPDYDFVLGETLINHPTIEYLTGRKGLPRFDGASVLPLRSDKSVALFLEPQATQALAMLRDLYPGGETQPLRPPGGGSPIMYSFVVQRAEVLALRGADVTCYPNQNWDGEAAVAGRVRTLDLPWSSSQLPPLPFTATWRSSLLAPTFGRYVFSIEAGGAAELFIDGSKTAGAGQRQEVILPKGLHTLEMRALLTEKRAPRLMWQPPESAQLSPIPGDLLFGSPASSNGLQGSYFRNGDWAGQPEFQQVDPFLDIRFHILPFPRPYSVEWTGRFLAPLGGQFRFAVESADATSLYLDEKVVATNEGAPRQLREGVAQLAEGFHTIRVRYQDKSNNSFVRLYWTPPEGQREVLPRKYLFPPRATYTGLLVPEIQSAPSGVSTGQPQPAATGPIQAGYVRSVTGGDQGFGSPRDVAVSADGTIYVADAEKRAVLSFKSDGSPMGPLPGSFGEPSGVAVGPDGQIAVLDAVGEQPLHIFGPDRQTVSSTGKELGMYRPRGLSVDSAGNLYVADTGRGRVLKLTASGKLVAEYRASGQMGQPVSAVAQGNTLLVADAEKNRIWVLEEGDKVKTSWPIAPASTINGPHLALGPRRELLVTDPPAGMVRAFDSEGRSLGQFGGPGTGSGQLSMPTGMKVGSNGSLLVADTGNKRVQEWTLK